MDTLCKLTSRDMMTGFLPGAVSTQWELHVPVMAARADRPPLLCSEGVIHAYRTPELAALLNPAHADFNYPRFFLHKPIT